MLDRPYWLGTEPVTKQTISSLRLIWPDEAPAYLRRRTDQAGGGSRPLATVAVAAPGRRWGHLTVVDGGKA
jgi:hypothetical protein